MSRPPRAGWLTVLALLAGGGGARADGGLGVEEQGAPATALAGAATARAADASSVFYNPAGLALQGGGDVLLGGALVVGRGRITSADGTVADSGSSTALRPALFAGVPVRGGLVVGIGVFRSLDAGFEPADAVRDGATVPFPGRFIASRFRVEGLTVNPTVALRVGTRFAVGVGLDVTSASFGLARELRAGDEEVRLGLSANAETVAWNAGLQASLVPGRLRIGLAWRAGYELAFGGRAQFTAPVELQARFPDQPATVRLAVPALLALGIAVMPTRGVTLTADVRLALSSDVRTLRVALEPSRPDPLVYALGWRDALSLRLGLEWRSRTGVALRLGFGYEQSAIPAATLSPLLASPANDRLHLAAGLGYSLTGTRARGLGISAGYLAMLSHGRTSSHPDLPGAAYEQSAHTLAVTLEYRYGDGTPR